MTDERIAFFDVDHTLIGLSTGTHYALGAFRRRLVKLSDFAVIPRKYLAYRLGDGGMDFYRQEFPCVSGFPPAILAELAEEVFEKRIWPKLFPLALKLVEERRRAGARIVLATSSLDFIIRPLARRIGAEELLCTALQFADGLTTGRIEGDPVFGPYKLERARSYAAAQGIGLEDCAFYTDSIHDLPLMLEVGKPVAVNPDFRLRKEAVRRGWEILQLRGDSGGSPRYA